MRTLLSVFTRPDHKKSMVGLYCDREKVNLFLSNSTHPLTTDQKSGGDLSLFFIDRKHLKGRIQFYFSHGDPT
jgi:hypothetical protein